jgi:hypothetical protein
VVQGDYQKKTLSAGVSADVKEASTNRLAAFSEVMCSLRSPHKTTNRRTPPPPRGVGGAPG